MDFTKYGTTLEELEGDLMFGRIPDDNDDASGGEIDEFDAVNDETFGAELGGTVDAELEDYAAQTARLRLDDPVWNPPSAANAPDASQVPMPEIFFDTSLFYKSDIEKAFTNGDMGRSLWGASSASSSSNIWGAPEPLNMNEKSFLPFLEQSLPNFLSHSTQNDDTRPSQSTPGIPVMPSTAMKLEDFEKSQITPKTYCSKNYEHASKEETLSEPQLPSSSYLPSLPATACSIQDIERQMLEEAKMRSQAQFNQPIVVQKLEPPVTQRVVIPQGPEIPAAVPFPVIHHSPQQMMGFPAIVGGVIPPIPPVPPAFLPLFPVWISNIMGRSYLPPNVPPPPPFLIHLMHVVKDPRMVLSMIMQSARSQVPNAHYSGMQLQHQQQQQQPQHRVFNRKPPGMPSGRTIQDLAFDAYAGYMSWKEREWLVKIQIYQCQGSGDTFVEDYYYTNWRERMIASGWTPLPKVENLEKENEKRKARDYHERARRMNYRDQNKEREKGDKEPRERPPLSVKFAGSLGLPSKSSTSNPRHCIKVKAAVDNASSAVTDEERLQAAQKKLRTMLMRLESAIVLLLEAEELSKPGSRQASFKNLTSEEKSIELNFRVETIIGELMGDEIPKVLQMNKGRMLVSRLLKVAATKDQARILIAVCSSSGLVNKKIAKEITLDILPVFFSSLAGLNRDQFYVFLSALNTDSLQKSMADENTFSRDLLVTILYVCKSKDIPMTDNVLGFVQTSSFPSLLWTDATSSLKPWALAMSLRKEDVQQFNKWLRYFLFASTSQLSQMLEAVF